MPQAAPLDPPQLTPLAPSVEKAYYRKCIQLKRRLNEVEAANDETKLRRLRLDRAIMKMRLERAFLLDELRKRMDQDVDGSDGSGDEGMATPPPDRPHRDKRRRPQTSQPPTAEAPPTNSFHTATYTPSAQRTTSDPNAGTPVLPGPGANVATANAVNDDGNSAYVDPAHPSSQGQTPSQPPALPHGSPYGPPTTGVLSASTTNGMDIDASNEQAERPISREAGATGASVGAGHVTVEENGERRVVSDDPNTESQDGGPGAFTAVNN